MCFCADSKICLGLQETFKDDWSPPYSFLYGNPELQLQKMHAQSLGDRRFLRVFRVLYEDTPALFVERQYLSVHSSIGNIYLFGVSTETGRGSLHRSRPKLIFFSDTGIQYTGLVGPVYEVDSYKFPGIWDHVIDEMEMPGYEHGTRGALYLLVNRLLEYEGMFTC